MKNYTPPTEGTFRLHELQLGDIIAISRKNGFLPPKIQYFMRVQAHKKYKVELPEYYNHTLMVIDPAKLDVAEALGKGFVVHNIRKQYNENDFKNMLVFRLKEPLTEEEKIKILLKRQEMADKNLEYEVMNFTWWPIYIWTNGRIDWGPKGRKSGKRVFCFEASCDLLDAGRDVFRVNDRVSTVDLQMDNRFNQYYLTK